MVDCYKKPPTAIELRAEANRYLRAKEALRMLRGEYLAKRITPQEYKTLRGHALSGDIDGAYKGVGTILRRNG